MLNHIIYDKHGNGLLHQIVYDEHDSDSFGYVVEIMEGHKIVIEMAKSHVRFWCYPDEVIFLRDLVRKHPWAKYFMGQDEGS